MITEIIIIEHYLEIQCFELLWHASSTFGPQRRKQCPLMFEFVVDNDAKNTIAGLKEFVNIYKRSTFKQQIIAYFKIISKINIFAVSIGRSLLLLTFFLIFDDNNNNNLFDNISFFGFSPKKSKYEISNFK